MRDIEVEGKVVKEIEGSFDTGGTALEEGQAFIIVCLDGENRE